MTANALIAAARRLKLMAFDVDGIFTDGKLYYGPDGEAMKAFHVHDGHGLKKLARDGVTLALITGRQSGMVLARAKELGIEHVIQGRDDKAVALSALAEELGIEQACCGYAGDDEPDQPALEWAALAFSVPNGQACAQDAADYVTNRSGGDGAVREICDLILSARHPEQE